MGIIFSRFKKKVSTKEKLENIQNEIVRLEEYRNFTERRGKKLVGHFVLTSLLLCIITSIFCYIYYLPPTLEERLLFATPFAGFLLIVYFLKRILSWYFRRKVVSNEKKLSKLSKEKDEILDQVMETETYKVAKEILEIYAPEVLKKTMTFKSQSPPAASVSLKKPFPPTPGSEVRRRVVPTPAAQAGLNAPITSTPYGVARSNIAPAYGPPSHIGMGGAGTPLGRPGANVAPLNRVSMGNRQFHPSMSQISTPVQSNWGPTLAGVGGPAGPPGPPMPRPIPPRERGMMDRFIEYLVGDGPSNRYALICRKCESHNGMALKEEFEYTAFRCAYCFHWNHARKQRPTAPKIESLASRPLLTAPAEAAGGDAEREGEEENERDPGISLIDWNQDGGKGESGESLDEGTNPLDADDESLPEDADPVAVVRGTLVLGKPDEDVAAVRGTLVLGKPDEDVAAVRKTVLGKPDESDPPSVADESATVLSDKNDSSPSGVADGTPPSTSSGPASSSPTPPSADLASLSSSSASGAHKD